LNPTEKGKIRESARSRGRGGSGAGSSGEEGVKLYAEIYFRT